MESLSSGRSGTSVENGHISYRITETAMSYEQILVECYSSFKANERPVAFTFHDRRWEVAEIIDRWYEGGIEATRPQVDYFKVRTTEGDVFLLRYSPVPDTWEMNYPEASHGVSEDHVPAQNHP